MIAAWRSWLKCLQCLGENKVTIDPALLAVVTVSFFFISVMILMRMSATGKTKRLIIWSLTELWLTLALWLAVWWAVSHWRGGLRIGASVILLFVVGLTAHLLWSLRKNMSGNIRF